MPNNALHEPVLVKEILAGLGPVAHLNSSVKIIDATLGTGGHSLAFVTAGYQVLGIEADVNMLNIAKARLSDNAKLINGNFKDIDRFARENNFFQVDAIIFDLGVSNIQLTDLTRGFSFGNPDAALDMRLDVVNQSLTAADLLNVLRPDQLEQLFKRVLKPWVAGKLSQEIVRVRAAAKFNTVGDFIRVCTVVSAKPGLNQATLPFLALRIAVNSELENLQEGLPKALELVRSGGRILIIYFHSKEKEIVMNFVKRNKNNMRLITLTPIGPGNEEIKTNPRARSARLVILEKI